jgi:hypothetical protein
MVAQAASAVATSPSRTAQRFGHVLEPGLAVGLGTHVRGADVSVNSVDMTEDGHLVAVCSAASAGKPSRSTGGLGRHHRRRARTRRRRAAAGWWWEERSEGDG